MTIPKKFLIIRYGAIGDVVHTTNTFRSIKSAYPDTEIHYLTFFAPAELLKNDKDIDKVICINKNDLEIFNQKKLIDTLKKQNYNLAINLQPNLKTKILLFRSGIKNITTYQKDYNLHAVVNFWQTATNAIPNLKCETELKLYIDKSTQDSINNKISHFKRPFVAINAGGIKSPRQGRCYPIEKWLKVGQKIQDYYNGTIFITGLKEDSELLYELEQINNSVNFTGQLTLQELAALFKQCDLLLSGDSGPLHIADAAGTKVVGLFGSMMAARSGPYGQKNKTIISATDCAPCNKRKCKYSKYRTQTYQKCMTNIPEEEVFEAAKMLLDKKFKKEKSKNA